MPNALQTTDDELVAEFMKMRKETICKLYINATLNAEYAEKINESQQITTTKRKSPLKETLDPSPTQVDVKSQLNGDESDGMHSFLLPNGKSQVVVDITDKNTYTRNSSFDTK